MNTNLQQFTISYIAEQDRLLLKIKATENNEFRIWFTRRYTVLLLKVLSQKMEAFGGIDAIAVSEETQQQIKGGAFSKQYEIEDEAVYPLGEEGILAYQLKVGPIKDTKNLSLHFLPLKGQGITISVDKKILFMLHTLLLQSISKADWGIVFEQPAANQLH